METAEQISMTSRSRVGADLMSSFSPPPGMPRSRRTASLFELPIRAVEAAPGAEVEAMAATGTAAVSGREAVAMAVVTVVGLEAAAVATVATVAVATAAAAGTKGAEVDTGVAVDMAAEAATTAGRTPRAGTATAMEEGTGTIDRKSPL
jgi:hypothetical protein